jgi:hypothetical protein
MSAKSQQILTGMGTAVVRGTVVYGLNLSISDTTSMEKPLDDKEASSALLATPTPSPTATTSPQLLLLRADFAYRREQLFPICYSL